MKSHEKISVTPLGGVHAEGPRAIVFGSLIVLVGMPAAFALGRGSAIIDACLSWKLF